MIKKNLTDYLPLKSEKKMRLVQAKVDSELFKSFKPLLKADGHTIKMFIEASMQKFIDEKA